MTEQAAVPMIVMTRSEDNAEEVNRTLRNAGIAVHCERLPDGGDLRDALLRRKPEMLLVFLDEPGVDLTAIMAVRNKTAADVPVLVISDKFDEVVIAAAMRMGASDIVTLRSTERLQYVAARELNAYRQRKALLATQATAQEYREQLHSFLEGSADAITHVKEGIVVDANHAWAELFGYSGEEVLAGTPLMDLFEPESHAVLKGALVACLKGKWTDHTLLVQAALSDGSSVPIELMLARAEHEDEPAVRIWIPTRQRPEAGRDARPSDAKPSDAGRRDATSGMLQTKYLIDSLRARCATPMKGGVREFVYVEVDHFTDLQNSLGVLATEDFIGQLAPLLRNQLSPTDLCGRFGGHGFLLLLERGTTRDVENWAKNLVNQVYQHKFSISGKNVSATITAGLGLLASTQPDVDAAANDAISANRRGLDLGGNQMYVVEKADSDTRVQAYDKIWVRHIKSALMENRFRLVQQPIASLLGSDKGMYDILVRMLDEQQNEVLPSEFMAAAERNDLMKNIDRWVIGASIALCAARKADCIFVRISKDTVLDKSLLGWLESQLRSVRVEPKRLCIQVSEELASQYYRQTQELAQTLVKLGFRFALEHFGTGREPLRLLAEIDLHYIKVDGSLMQGLTTNNLQQQRVKGLVEAAQRKNVQTIAERVEDANTMAVLWQLGIQFIQGYFVNAPENVTLSGDR